MKYEKTLYRLWACRTENSLSFHMVLIISIFHNFSRIALMFYLYLITADLSVIR